MNQQRMEELFDVAGAEVELREKSSTQIEVETAHKWAGRAVAAYRLYKDGGDLRVRDQAMDYAREAVEHAASALDGGATLRVVEQALRDELSRLGY